MISKSQKKDILDELENLSDNHEGIVNFYKESDAEVVQTLLQTCQEKAIEIGNTIESLLSEGFVTVSYLENYCEVVYEIHNLTIDGFKADYKEVEEKLNNAILNVIESVNKDIQVKKEAVFLPYKASMWDSLETVWQRYDADPEWNAVVIPIPYYDRNPDGSFGTKHYEGNEFPKDVPVTMYNRYDFAGNHPEEIYIINPYDANNYVTSVEPFFYSDNLKKYTDCLVYIPYFVINEPDISKAESIKEMEHFALVPGVCNADKIILQSENMRLAYIKILTKKFGEKTRKIWERRIFGTGSPKIEKIMSASISDYELPQEWKNKIYKENGEKKKVVLYNTSIGAFLVNPELMLEKMGRVFETFYENAESITLLWRPHPLLESTIASMLPNLLEEYRKMVEKYKTDNIGIYDDSPDMDRALVLSDAYYGDQSSLVVLYQKTNKPIMIQNANL